jgi:hypothetical protein
MTYIDFAIINPIGSRRAATKDAATLPRHI